MRSPCSACSRQRSAPVRATGRRAGTRRRSAPPRTIHSDERVDLACRCRRRARRGRRSRRDRRSRQRRLREPGRDRRSSRGARRARNGCVSPPWNGWTSHSPTRRPSRPRTTGRLRRRAWGIASVSPTGRCQSPGAPSPGSTGPRRGSARLRTRWRPTRRGRAHAATSRARTRRARGTAAPRLPWAATLPIPRSHPAAKRRHEPLGSRRARRGELEDVQGGAPGA